MSLENIKNGEKFNTAKILSLFDAIEDSAIVNALDQKANKAGFTTIDILRNTIEMETEDNPQKNKRLGELLTVLSTTESSDLSLIDEKIDELLSVINDNDYNTDYAEAA